MCNFQPFLMDFRPNILEYRVFESLAGGKGGSQSGKVVLGATRFRGQRPGHVKNSFSGEKEGRPIRKTVWHCVKKNQFGLWPLILVRG